MKPKTVTMSQSVQTAKETMPHSHAHHGLREKGATGES